MGGRAAGRRGGLHRQPQPCSGTLAAVSTGMWAFAAVVGRSLPPSAATHPPACRAPPPPSPTASRGARPTARRRWGSSTGSSPRSQTPSRGTACRARPSRSCSDRCGAPPRWAAARQRPCARAQLQRHAAPRSAAHIPLPSAPTAPRPSLPHAPLIPDPHLHPGPACRVPVPQLPAGGAHHGGRQRDARQLAAPAADSPAPNVAGVGHGRGDVPAAGGRGVAGSRAGVLSKLASALSAG